MHFSLTDLAADIAQNGAESGASLIELSMRETAVPSAPIPVKFRFVIKDNGKGMSKETLNLAKDPFVTDGIKHPGRRVGLGIPFLIQTALDSGGGWRINSTRPDNETAALSGGIGASTELPRPVGESGTIVEAWFDLNNLDSPPVGDIPGLFRMVLVFSGPKEVILRRIRKGVNGKSDLDYEVKKTEIADVLGGDLEDVTSLVLLGQYLRSLEDEQ